MGTNTLETAYSNGQIIDASHINELTASVLNQFVGRNTSGVPELGKSLGTAAIPWGAVHADSVILNGQAVDTSKITSLANRIISGATRADSDQPAFLKADGTVASMTVLGAVTNITLSINAIATTVSTDIVKTGLTLAPATNNTCLVNDVDMLNDKYAGEDDTKIIVDTMGSEIISKIGQYVGLKTATGEIMYAYVESSTVLTNVFRGYFFDDTGAPIVRGNLSNNDTLTLINLGWVFVEDNGTTVDVSYIQPIYSFDAPSGPATGQYWFDITNQTWKRYSGTEFDIINRILIGTIALDDTAAIATRAGDFSNSFSNQNNVELDLFSTEIILSNEFVSRVNVYGTEIIQDLNKLSWNMTTDLEGGLSELSDMTYYIYLSIDSERIISDEKPYYRADLEGFYHPYHTWRCMGISYNNSSSDLENVQADRYNPDSFTESAVNVVGGNGYGNVRTLNRRFTTLIEDIGLDLTYEDSVGDGMSITINGEGEYSIVYNDSSNALSTLWSITLNAPSIGVSLLSPSERLARVACHVGNTGYSLPCSIVRRFKKGDVLRAIADSGQGTQAHLVAFSVRKIRN